MTGRGATGDQAGTLTVRVPLVFRKHGGRKQVVTPDGATGITSRARIDNTMVKAIARAHRWKRMLDDGEYATVQELAVAEKINQSYLCRVLRLTLVAPDIVEAILDGRQPPGLQLDPLLAAFPVEWQLQRVLFRLIT